MKRNVFCGLLGVLCLIALFSCLSDADSAEWISFSSLDLDEWCYDAESVIRSNDVFTVWTKRYPVNEKGRLSILEEYKKVGLYTKEFDDWQYALLQVDVDCRKKLVKSLSAAEYSKNGSVILSSNFRNKTSWEDIIPESRFDGMYDLICEKKSFLKKKRNWRYLGISVYKDRYYYDDANILQLSKNMIKAWRKEIISEQSKKALMNDVNSNKDFEDVRDLIERKEYGIASYEIDCSTKKIRQLQECSFDKADIGYYCLNHDRYVTKNYLPRSDDQISLIKVVCSQKGSSKETKK